jgi:Phospholipid-translocating P-type ATPase C-terminal
VGILDRDVSAEIALRYPKLFDVGRLNKIMNVRVFLSWLGEALVEAVVVFYICTLSYIVPDAPPGRTGAAGATPYVFQLGLCVFSCVIGVVTMRVAAEMHSHFWFFQFMCFLSSVLFIPAMYVFSVLNNDNSKGLVSLVYGSLDFWATLVLVLGITTTRTIAWKGYKRFYRPDLRHIVQEAETITNDFSSVNSYTEAAGIARLTGKSVADVYRAAVITEAAITAVHVRKNALGAIAALSAAGREKKNTTDVIVANALQNAHLDPTSPSMTSSVSDSLLSDPASNKRMIPSSKTFSAQTKHVKVTENNGGDYVQLDATSPDRPSPVTFDRKSMGNNVNLSADSLGDAEPLSPFLLRQIQGKTNLHWGAPMRGPEPSPTVDLAPKDSIPSLIRSSNNAQPVSPVQESALQDIPPGLVDRASVGSESMWTEMVEEGVRLPPGVAPSPAVKGDHQVIKANVIDWKSSEIRHSDSQANNSGQVSTPRRTSRANSRVDPNDMDNNTILNESLLGDSSNIQNTPNRQEAINRALNILGSTMAGIAIEVTGTRETQPLVSGPSLDTLTQLQLENERELLNRARAEKK